MKSIKEALQIFLWLTKKMTTQGKILICIASLISMSGGFITSFIPKTIGKLLDLYSDQKAVITTLVFLGGLYFLNELTIVFRRLIVERIATNLSRNLIVQAVDKILHLDMDFIQRQKSGSINFKVQNSVTGSTKLVKLFFMDLIPSFFIMFFAIGITFYQSAVVGLVLLFILPINIWVILLQLKSQRGIRVGLIRSQEDIQGNVIEMIAGIEETRVTNFENEQIQKIEKNADKISETEYKHHKGMVRFDFTKGSLKWLFHIVILAISLYMALHNYITIGDILTYSLLYMAAMKPIEEIHRYLDELQENSIKAKDLKEILKNYPIDNTFSVIDVLQPIIRQQDNSIDVSKLNFEYNGRNGENVFNNLSLTIKKGTYVGIVGESGCGKSTLIKNILKIYQGKGNIFIQGLELKNITREKLAKQFIYVPQTPFIFNGTIRENMIFGCKEKNVSDEQLKDAAKKANLLEFIQSLTNSFDTMITEGGKNLSGGQRQRISLSRIFVNSAKPIIILDEATSAIDNTTEAKIYENLLKTGKTIVSIAHRLNTLTAADKIIVMNKNGQIVQKGTYAELTNTDGIFSRLTIAHYNNKTKNEL